MSNLYLSATGLNKVYGTDLEAYKKLAKVVKFKRILLIDNAMLTATDTSYVDEILRDLQDVGGRVVKITLSPQNVAEIDKHDILYFAGGDERQLLKLAQDKRVKSALVDYLQNDGIIIGKSGAAKIFGLDKAGQVEQELGVSITCLNNGELLEYNIEKAKING